MNSYYATVAVIRYYGQMPNAVGKTDGAVWATGVKSAVFGENVLTTDWRALLETATNQPFDLAQRKEPAHEVLANMALDLGSLYVFTKKWGCLNADLAEQDRLIVRVQHVRPLQDLLQRAWRGESSAIGEMAKDVKARVDVCTSGMEIAVVDLWSLIRLMFLRDYRARKAKICANPDCHSPYFLQERKGQKYCTHKCAVLMNVRRFREREAKAKSQSKRRAKG